MASPHLRNARPVRGSLCGIARLAIFALALVLAAAAVFPLTARAEQPSPPATPSSVTVTRYDGSLTASWPAVDGATSYHVTYSSDGGASWSLAALNHPGASMTISGVDNAKTYIVGVRARSDGGDSGWINSAPAGPFTPPTPEPTPALSFGDASVADQSWTKGTAIDALTLPEAMGGSGTVTYSLSKDLPAGLSFDPATRAVTGTPTAASGASAYTYSATDGTETATLQFKIQVTQVSGSDDVTTQIAGCNYLTPTNVQVAASSDPSYKLFALSVKFTLSFAGSKTHIDYRKKGASTWTETTHGGNQIFLYLEQLDESTTYEVRGGISDSGEQYKNCGTMYYATQEATTGSKTKPAKPKAPTVTTNSTNPKTVLDVSWKSVYAAPAVSDYDVQYRVKGTSSWTSHSFTGTTTSTTITGLTNGTTYEVEVRGVNDQGDGSWSDPGEGTTEATNVDPEFSDDTATRSIAENSAAGTSIGAAVTATDTESDTLTYSLTGTDASKFDIGSSTGQISVKTGNVPDYEAKTSYSVTVNVTDKKDSDGTADKAIDDTIAVTINVTDADEPPAKPAAPTVAANSTTPTTKLDVSWMAPAMTGKPAISDYDVQYRKTGDSSWTDASFTGTGTSTTLTGLDSGKTYEVQVRAANDEGSGGWSDSGTGITDANAVTRSIAENSAAVTAIGAAVTAKANSKYTYTHSLDGTDKDSFTIESSSGQIKVKTGNVPDYETKTSYSVTVIVAVAAAGGGGSAQSLDPNAPGSYTIPVTINVTNVNEGSEFADDTATRSIAENSAAGTSIGAAVTAGADPEGDTLTYSLAGTDASKFTIESSSGQIKVKTGNVPDYEAKTSYSVTVNVTDKKDSSGTADTVIDDTISVTINVTDESEPPAKPAAPTVSANSTTPETKVDVSWTAPDMTGKPAISDYDVQYRLSGDSSWTSHSFTGTGTSTTLTGLTKGKTYEVQVRATNDEGTSGWSDSGTAITQAGGVTRSVAENSAAGTNVGAAVTAANASYTYTHSLSGTDASKFEIGSTTGQITVKTGTSLDYEAKTSYSVTVTVTAAAKSQGNVNAQSVDPNAPGDYIIPVTINVTDVNEGPEFADDTATRSIEENSAAGTNIGAAVAAGADPEGDTLTYSLTGTDASKFDIGSSTGQITVKTGNVPDYEAKTSYSVTVNVTDKKAANGTADTAIDDTIAVTITVTDADEPPAAPAAPSVWQKPQTPKTKLKVSWTAPTMTGKPAITDYDVQYKKASDDDWTSHSFTGTGTTTELTGLTEGTKYDVQVKAINDEGNSGWSDSGTASTQDKNVHAEFPSATATRSIDENSAAGTAIGTAVTATDTEGHTLTYSLTGTDAASVDLDTATGQLKVKSGNVPDYEAKTSYSVTVGVSDGKDTDNNPDTEVDDTIDITISVTDVAEPPAAPTLTVSPSSTEPETKISVSWTAPVMTGKPALSGYDVQYKLADDSSWTSHTFSGTGTSTTLTGLTAGKSYDVRVRATNDEGDGSWATDRTVTDGNSVTRSIAENSATGTAIGSAVTATSNPNGYTLTHSLGGTDAASFSIESSSGRIKVKAALDYETKSSYSVIVTVRAASAGVQSASLEPNAPGDYTVPVTIRVTDVNEPPQFPSDTATRTVEENSAAGTNIGAVITATDQDGDTLYYSLTGTDAASFDIGSGTGQITVKSGNVPDHEAKSSYSVTVNVTDKKKADGTADTSIDDTIAVTVNITDADEPPAKPAAPTVSANSATPTSKVDVSWTAPDMDGKPAITDYDVRYRLSGGSAWTSHSFTGTGTSTSIAGLDSGKSYEVQVRATNDEGNSPWSGSGTAITTAAGASRSVAENSAAGTAIGAPVTASSNPNGYALTHTLSGTDAASFSIDGSSGQIKVKAALDYETKKTYSVTVTVKAASSGGAQAASLEPNAPGSYTVPVSITVTDVNETARFSDPDPSSHTVPENSPAGIKIGAPVTAVDPEGDALTYSLSGTDAAKFDIGSATGQITLGRGTNLDYESGTISFDVTVNATDGKDENDDPDTAIDHTIDVTIGVTDVLEPPEAPTAPGASPSATAPSTALDVTWTAPRMTGKPPITGYDVHYRRVGDSNWISHSFTGTGTSTTIKGLTSGTTYEVRVNATNDEGTSPWSDSATAAPSAASASRSVAENSPAGTAVGAPVTAGSGSGLTHTLSGTDAAKFAIDAGTGQISVGSGTSLDHESRASYSVSVSVSPGSHTVPVTITVTDADEPPAPPAVPSVSAGASAPTTELDVAWTAPDMTGRPGITSYGVRYRKAGETAWNAHVFTGTGTATTLAGLDPGTTYEAQVRAANAEGVSAWSPTGTGSTNPVGGTPDVAAPHTKITGSPARPDAPSVTQDSGAPTIALIVDWSRPSSNGSAITGYRLRYRAKGTSAWTTQAAGGTATTAKLTGLASATTYEAQVRAVNSLGAGRWSDSGVGTTAMSNGAPSFPLPGSPLRRSVAENSPAGTAVGGPVEATDPDGDALTYAISGASEFTIDSATGQIRVAQGANIDYESVSSYTVTVTVTVTDGLDALGNADSSADDTKQVNISVIDVDETEPVKTEVPEPMVEQQAESVAEPEPNAAPSLSAPDGLKVAENSPAGTAVGDPVPATDPEGNSLTFALSGAAEFAIDPATGQITVAEGAALDHESVSSYTVTVTVSDGLDAAGNADASADDSAQIAIAVTDVDEPPARPGAPSLTRDRNSPTSKLIVAWDAPATTGPAITGYGLRYRAKGASDWTDHPLSDTAATATIGGLESGTTYEAQVRAINDEGAGPWSEPGSGSTARPFGKTVYPIHEGGIARVTAATPAPQPAEEKAPTPTSTAAPAQSDLRLINPSDKDYSQGETIQSFNVIVFGGPTSVTLSGLPDGLSYASGAVSGTVASDAKVGTYPVTITASDATGLGATGEFTITVTEPGAGILQLKLFSVPVWRLALVPPALFLLLLAYRRWRSNREVAVIE